MIINWNCVTFKYAQNRKVQSLNFKLLSLCVSDLSVRCRAESTSPHQTTANSNHSRFRSRRDQIEIFISAAFGSFSNKNPPLHSRLSGKSPPLPWFCLAYWQSISRWDNVLVEHISRSLVSGAVTMATGKNTISCIPGWCLPEDVSELWFDSVCIFLWIFFLFLK